jgi:hypothetical protein
MQEVRSVAEAWDIYRQPARYRALQRAGIPTDILDVIKISAGDTATTAHWSDQLGAPQQELGDAANYYLHQFMAGAGKDPLRLLCLTKTATAQDFKLHKRWLLKWLHPDRNPSAWDASLFRRINAAASAMEQNFAQAGEAGAVEAARPVAATLASPVAGAARARRAGADAGGRKLHGAKPVVRVRQANWQGLRKRMLKRAVRASYMVLALYVGYQAVLLMTDQDRSVFASVSQWWG